MGGWQRTVWGSGSDLAVNCMGTHVRSRVLWVERRPHLPTPHHPPPCHLSPYTNHCQITAKSIRLYKSLRLPHTNHCRSPIQISANGVIIFANVKQRVAFQNPCHQRSIRLPATALIIENAPNLRTLIFGEICKGLAVTVRMTLVLTGMIAYHG